MASIDIKGSRRSRKPFVCGLCGETFQPPSRYILIRLGSRLVKVCLICERYG